MIVTPIGVDIAQYPAIFAHLSQWQEALEKRWDKGKHWWELRACDYYPAFAQPKIVFPDLAKEMRFAYEPAERFFFNTTYFIAADDLFLLGLLNSRPIELLYAEVSNKARGDYFRFFRQYVEKIPIAKASRLDQNATADLVQHCLDTKGVNCAEWEREIDARMAALYGLGET